jgi:hypothetical protein
MQKQIFGTERVPFLRNPFKVQLCVKRQRTAQNGKKFKWQNGGDKSQTTNKRSKFAQIKNG